ncbi:MAG: CRISPR-associated endonuclease Cas1 [Chthonomonadales bacterium]|nr:CRISPR-associated endonuclease Cas1 [Chthonomonadales bacterium]
MILYIDEQGAELHKTGERLIVQKDDVEIAAVRLRELEQLVLVGPVDLTTPAMHTLIDHGVDTCFLTAGGRYRGRLAPAEGKNVLLRQAQFRRIDDAQFRLTMARTIVGAKLANCRYVLLRYARNHPTPAVDEAAEALARAAASIDDQPDIDACMGAEGAAARAYFAAFGQMVRREFVFSERSRRPPLDPVNALLSFGYALTTTEIIGALASQGLDPDAGFMHALVYGRPALALDLLEEFRPLIADRIALKLINNGVLNESHFEPGEEGGVQMTEDGRAKYLRTYHEVLSREIKGGAEDDSVSFRKIFRTQAARMRAAIDGADPYNPHTPR